MTDEQLIEEVYQDTVERMCSQLFNVLLVSQNGAEREEAEQRFQAGVLKAREARDRAKKLLT